MTIQVNITFQWLQQFSLVKHIDDENVILCYIYLQTNKFFYKAIEINKLIESVIHILKKKWTHFKFQVLSGGVLWWHLWGVKLLGINKCAPGWQQHDFYTSNARIIITCMHSGVKPKAFAKLDKFSLLQKKQ